MCGSTEGNPPPPTKNSNLLPVNLYIQITENRPSHWKIFWIPECVFSQSSYFNKRYFFTDFRVYKIILKIAS